MMMEASTLEMKMKHEKTHFNMREIDNNTKSFLLTMAAFVTIVIIIALIASWIIPSNKKEVEEATVVEEAAVAEEEVEDPAWVYLVQALIVVESEGNPLAVGKSNDVGILQITPIYVREVNRILGDDIYTLDDRTCIYKSLAMFEVYQAHHNPNKDILRAIKVHNPGAGQWYTDKVMEQFNRLRF